MITLNIAAITDAYHEGEEAQTRVQAFKGRVVCLLFSHSCPSGAWDFGSERGSWSQSEALLATYLRQTDGWVNDRIVS